MRNTTTTRSLGVVAASALALGLMSGCSSSAAGTAAGADIDPEVQEKVDQCLAEVGTKIFNQGPHGETAVDAGELTLTEEEIEEVRGMGATVAIAWHVFGSDYSTAQVAALEDTFAELGIEVLTTTDGQFKVDKQTNDIQTILARKPDYMVSLPVDAPSQEKIYQEAADSGVKLVFALNAPPDMVAGEDYITVVGSDDYGTGVASACQLAGALNGQGKIGLIYHAAHYYATQQRLDAVHEVFKDFPDIEVVDEIGNPGPDFTGQSSAATNSMLSTHPDLNGIWAVWDTHADGVLAAAREMGKTGSDFAITSIDLGETIATDMAQGGMVKGIGGSQPYNQGVAEAMAIAYDLLGKEVGPYYAWPAIPVDRDNLDESWQAIYHQDAPDQILSALER